MRTSRGDFFVQVVREWAPRGADRFYNLVRNGFYDGNRFYRAIDGFIVQWGASGDPAVNRAWARQCIHDDPVRRTNVRRAVTFAFGRPNTRTTQVFINFGVNWRLDDSGFAPFFSRLTDLMGPLLPRYAHEGKTYLTIGIGCTGGRHRSVYVAERLAEWLRQEGQRVTVAHRDLELPADAPAAASTLRESV